MMVEPTMPTKKLTKKQLKATAFRAKKKIKDLIDEKVLPLPEDDEDEENEVRSNKKSILKHSNSNLSSPSSKKRKRSHSIEPLQPQSDDPESNPVVITSTVASKRRKRKKAAKLREQEEKEQKKSSKLILFVGNLPFDITADRLKKFFSEHCAEEPIVRLMTTKTKDSSNGPTEKPRTKGCGFIEFKTSGALQKALRLHHSPISSELDPNDQDESKDDSKKRSKSRKINIELTAGGGGKSENRLKKIQESQLRLSKQRDKLLEKQLKFTSLRKVFNQNSNLVNNPSNPSSNSYQQQLNPEFDVSIKLGGTRSQTSKTHRSNDSKNNFTNRAKTGFRPLISGANAIKLG